MTHCICHIHVDMEHCPRRFMRHNRSDPSVSKSNWLHVDVFRFFSIDTSLNFHQLFLKRLYLKFWFQSRFMAK